MRMGLRACSPRMRGCSLDQGWLERDPSEVLEHDLFNEDLHRRIKRGQARLGRLDAARLRLLSRLRGGLCELST